jgi:diguanylate cyclase (GGDEF)-like protein
MATFFSSIAARLVATVLGTGLLAFGLIGGLAMLRLDYGLQEQAEALGRLSARQLSDRLDAEAQLARARIDGLGSETSLRLRQLAQRADISKAIASRNDITIRELLAAVAKTSDIQHLIAFDTDGVPIGANDASDLLAINKQMSKSDLAADLKAILKNNSRSNPRGHQDTHVMPLGLLETLRLPVRLTVAHEALEPVFDDFGELIGALAGFRILGRSERTLENFSSLSNSGVAIMHGNEVVSGAGRHAKFLQANRDSYGLIHSDDGAHIARCADHDAELKVCTFTNTSAVTETRDQMFRIGAAETRSLMKQFLIVAGMALLALILALLAGVRHATLGLSTLASAARAVAAGNIDQPFKALGVGEVYSLGLAFEQMLANLRASMGKIRQLAFYDSTTGLPNRERFRLDSKGIIEKSEYGALWFLDLDRFKAINDTFGHKNGDALLRKVSERITGFFAEMCSNKDRSEIISIARVAGDEFVMIIPREQDHDRLGGLAKKLLERLSAPFEIEGSHVSIGASIGIAVFPADGKSYEELFINADLAMYAAKEKGRNTFAHFTSEIAENSKLKLALEQDLKIAVRAKQLSVQYQPTMSCKDGRVRGVEALARWHHPKWGNVSPQRFIAIAEETGLIQEIDRFVLQRAMEDIGRLIRSGFDIVLAVNVSAASIEDPFLMSEMEEVISSANFDPARLELEITESVAMRDPDRVRRCIAGFRKLGIRIAIDDFGAGYSNLATLSRLPVDTVKLDRSLVTNLTSESEKQTIVRTGLTLASELGFETVVEGVESMEELEFVTRCGATYAQGYLFSPPVSVDDLSSFLQPACLSAIAKSALKKPYENSVASIRSSPRVASG